MQEDGLYHGVSNTDYYENEQSHTFNCTFGAVDTEDHFRRCSSE